ncbi:LLM class flavin-dependent oxidoreductase, partial [Rhodococcus hoagii]|nr:LLM class flavin-dependent oxidoreductase [Prescottella equi]
TVDALSGGRLELGLVARASDPEAARRFGGARHTQRRAQSHVETISS